MTAWNETLAQYLRILQSEGRTHIELSQKALKTLRTLVAKPPATVGVLGESPQKVSTTPRVKEIPPISYQEKSVAMPSEKRIESKGVEPVEVVDSFSDLDLKTGTKSEKLDRLLQRANGCQRCSHLVATRTNVVFGGGNPEAKLMFVGEAPGPEDDQEGLPFVGASGQLLTKMIQAMGLQREDVYIANVMKCRPDMPPGSVGNRKPTATEMKSCLPYLQAQIEIIQPKILVALGATAMEGLLSNKTPMSKLRGTFLSYQGIPVMPTYHPTYLLRNQSTSEKRKVWEDLLKVMGRLELPISEKQRGFFLAK